MYRYHKWGQLFVFIIIVSFALNHSYNPFIEKNFSIGTYSVMNLTEIDDLYEKVNSVSGKYYEPPQNAYIDGVWKKTPGRSGIKINIDQSYENMKKDGKFNQSKLVYDDIPPEVTLNELEASPIYRGHPDKKMIALLINVSWGTEHIPDILKILKEHDVKATFFVEGKWAKENPNLVKMIDEQSHLVGNHAYNHPNMASMSEQQIYEQINETNKIIKAVIDKTPKWFAPPSGSFSDHVITTAHQLKMQTILWTVDTIDWKNPSVSAMNDRVLNSIHPGATILMHPTDPVVKGLSKMITEIKNDSYQIDTIEQLLSSDRE